jgi:N-acetylglucosaminyldiphosphoundecaprenol N-acetyl-beta-D-mannosaminyltransferase
MMKRFQRAFASGAGLNILGVRVRPGSLREAAGRILTWAGSPSTAPRLVFATGVHGIMEARRHPSFHAILEKADMNLPDGMPLVWIGRLSGFPQMERVSGPDLMLEVCSAGRDRGVRHFFCGGGNGVADKLAESLQRILPGLLVGGTFTPPMTPLTHEDYLAMAGAWKGSGGQIFWMGVSTPKQERWAQALLPMLHSGVVVTVGAAFDYHAGLRRRAPRWMQRSGLEWVYRLLTEPRRLAGRYITSVPAFIVLAALQLFDLLDSRTANGHQR